MPTDDMKFGIGALRLHAYHDASTVLDIHAVTSTFPNALSFHHPVSWMTIKDDFSRINPVQHLLRSSNTGEGSPLIIVGNFSRQHNLPPASANFINNPIVAGSRNHSGFCGIPAF